MSEGVGFVKAALLEEEHDQGLRAHPAAIVTGVTARVTRATAFDFHNGVRSPEGFLPRPG